MNKTKKLTNKQLDKLAVDLIIFLQQHDLFYMVNIYVNNKMLTDNRMKGSEMKTTPFGPYYIINDINPKDKIEYANPETITVTFEGPLYHFINYEGEHSLYKQLCNLFERHGLYLEQGYPWSFALYYM